MLLLIFNLLSISNCCDCETEGMIDLTIINCRRQRGELLDTGFLNNKSSYRLALLYKESFWQINITLHVGIVENISIIDDIYNIEVSKCTENIVMGIYNKNFKLNFVRERLFMCAETSYKKS
ncbi:hypothetical protein CDIK_4420, partial [Cucumispora dikerogammari]